MNFFVTYFWLNLKNVVRTRVYRCFGTFLLLLTLGFVLLVPRTDARSPFTLAILNEGETKLGAAVTATLTKDGGYRLLLCQNQRELSAAVLSGQAIGGYAVSPKADDRVANGRYTGLVDSFYREKSPVASLCDEAICGAVFAAIAPSIAGNTLALEGFPGLEQAAEEQFRLALAEGNPMQITLLGLAGQPTQVEVGDNLASLCTTGYLLLTGLFGIITVFYTNSIRKELVLAGQSRFVVGTCNFLAQLTATLLLLVPLAVGLVIFGL